MSVLIKGGRVITAADDYVADVFVDGERISLIGESLDVEADRSIDASRQVRPAGLRRPAHPSRHAVRRHGRRSTTSSRARPRPHSAARPATSTSASRRKGQTFADALADWHAKAEGKQVIDMGYHMAVTDLKEGGTLEELAALPDQGVTSYKLFMAYKGALMVDDETLFKTMEVAAETGALVMVHAENGDAIDVLVKRGAGRRQHRAALARAHAAARDRGRGDEPGDPARARRGRRRSTSSTSRARSRSSRSRSRARRAGTSGARRARSTSSSTTPFLERPDFEGAKYVYTPPPRDKANQDVLWNAVRTDVLSAISTDHCAFLWDGQKTLGQGRLLEDPERRPGAREPAADDPRVRRARGPDLAEPDGRAARDEPGEALRALSRARARSPSAPTRTSSSSTREKQVTISASTHHSKSDYNLYEGTEVTGTPEVVLLRGHVLVENGELVAKPGIGQFVDARQVRRGAQAGRAASGLDRAMGGRRHAALPVVLL